MYALDIEEPESPPVPQIKEITFDGQNLLPIALNKHETKMYKNFSFLGGTWYLISIDCSKLNTPLSFIEKNYLSDNWIKSSLEDRRTRWSFPLGTPYIDDENDLFFQTNKVNQKFGVYVRVSYRSKSEDLFFYISIPK